MYLSCTRRFQRTAGSKRCRCAYQNGFKEVSLRAYRSQMSTSNQLHHIIPKHLLYSASAATAALYTVRRRYCGHGLIPSSAQARGGTSNSAVSRRSPDSVYSVVVHVLQCTVRTEQSVLCSAAERWFCDSSLSSRISLASMSRNWCQAFVRFADVGVVEQFGR